MTVLPGANGGVVFPSAVLDGAAVLLAQLEVPSRRRRRAQPRPATPVRDRARTPRR